MTFSMLSTNAWAIESSETSIHALSIANNVATVNYEYSGNDAMVCVAVYDIETERMLLYNSAIPSSEDHGSISIPFINAVPDQYIAKAFLLQRETMRPLCNNYTRVKGFSALSHNIHKQDCDTYGSVITSYLFEAEGAIYRVQYDFYQLSLEQLDDTYHLLRSWEIPMELPKFGGFYAGNDGYYFVFGQDNPEESDSTEVIRVVRYNKDMERQDSASLYGANTSSPFSFASLRMDQSGDQLFLRTGHTMYVTSDGANHQANMTLVLNTKEMRFTTTHCMVSNIGTGYVSHSFNQFIKVDGDKMIAVDHGDGFPRGIVLTRTDADMSSGAESVNLLTVSGNIGDNRTGVSAGGFEISDSSYLTVGNTIDQDNFDNSKTRNIFLAVTSKDDLSVNYKQLTQYSEGGTYSASTPALVKVGDDLFAVMWERKKLNPSDSNYAEYENGVDIVFLDGRGNQLGDMQTFPGALSDCQPVVVDGAVTWYVAEDSIMQFYSYRPIRSGASVTIQPIESQPVQLSTEIIIPGHVTNIGWGAFSGRDYLTSVKIESGVINISAQAFMNCSKLTSITIPDSVTNIDDWAFAGCVRMKSIAIPSTITTIKDCTFWQCNELKDVYYSGSEEQWNAIKIGSFNESLSNAVIHFNAS